MAVDKEKNTQVLVTIPNDMLKLIEEVWFEQKFRNRSEAIRYLLKDALVQHGKRMGEE